MQVDNKEKTKRGDDGFSTRQTTQTRIRSFLRSVHFRYIILPSVVLSAVTVASATSPTSFILSDKDHLYLELFAVILSTIVAFYCITRAYTLNEKFSLFVGIGFATIAVIDLLHAAFSYWNLGNDEFLRYFIPQTWFAGRTFLGAMLVIAVAKYAPKVEKQDEQQIEKEEGNDVINRPPVEQGEEKLQRSLLLPLSLLALLAISVVAISFLTEFPGIVLSSVLARPYENPSLILFSIA